MRHLILLLSDYSFHILQNAVRGTVHSVYRRTVNLSVGGSLLALQAKDSPLSPISLITDLPQGADGLLPLRPGQEVSIDPKARTLTLEAPDTGETAVFVFDQSRREDLALSATFLEGQSGRLFQSIRSILRHAPSDGFTPLFVDDRIPLALTEDSLSPVLSLAAERLKAALRHIQRAKWQEAAAQLRGLIGLGIGLTPSGDDFLCGVLAGWILGDFSDHPLSRALRMEIYSHLTDTNDISAAFLNCALEGQFSLAVRNLARLPDPVSIRDAFEKIGHSSGFDTLCGISFAFYTKGLIQTMSSPSSG